MVSREIQAPGKVKGGFLMAPPGHGKTIMSLALTAICPPKYKTLIVVPVGLELQWWDEMETHLEQDHFEQSARFRDFKQHGKTFKANPFARKRIVLVTYEQLKRDTQNESKSLLCSVNWGRIIFDEGQAIKNHRSKKFIACHKLKAERRWILSGTLIMNDLWNELYAYLTLLRVEEKDQMSMKKFRKTYVKGDLAPKKLANAREYMAQIQTNQRFLGYPLCTLPPNRTIICPVSIIKRAI
jgi:SWI/SNF-related matrix-associated actin-dependent regulator of chromatin subfamily A3